MGLLLETLNLILPIDFVLNCVYALLFGNQRSLLARVVELDLHLVHFLHRSLMRGRPVGLERLRVMLLVLVVERGT